MRMLMPQISTARRNRLVLILALTTLVLVILWVARGALVPYVFALALAYLMLPAVNRLDALFKRVFRGRGVAAARPIAILIVYMLTAGGLVLFFLLVLPVIAQQFEVLWNSRDQLLSQGTILFENIVEWYQRSVPANLQAQLNSLVQQAGGTVARSLQAGLTRTLGFVTDTFGFVLGLVVIPFWLFYILHDQAKAMRGVFGLIPARFRTDTLNLLRVVDDILSAYIRGQLLLCLFIGVLATVGLSLLGVRFPAVLGLVAGVFEILPFIGPILGLVPAVIVAVIQAPLLGLWTLLLFLGIQQAENLFLVPRISGKAVQLHPAVIMVVLVLGNQIAGFWGLVLAVPVTAVIRDVFKYLYLRSQDEPVSPKEALARLGRTPLQIDL
jgi:predicted PurR-regulated permease PerM